MQVKNSSEGIKEYISNLKEEIGMVGFIGLGIMGKPMARNLLKAGVELMVNDVNRSVVEELAAEGAKAAARQEIGAACDVVFTILPNGAIVQDVLFGGDGVAASLKAGAIVCDCSSVTPPPLLQLPSRLLPRPFLPDGLRQSSPGPIQIPLSVPESR